MMRDDTTSHPMDPIRLLHFRGLLCRETIRCAAEAIRARHPLLNSLAVKRGNRHWRVETAQKPELAFLDADTALEVLNASGFPQMRPLDLLHEPGFRLYAVFSQKEKTYCAIRSGHIPQEMSACPQSPAKSSRSRRVSFSVIRQIS